MSEVEVQYPLNGGTATFDISANKTEKFSLFYQDRVQLPDGVEATVVGVRADTLWFLPVGAVEPIKFDGIKDAADIAAFQIRKLQDCTSAALNLQEGYIRGEHKVRQIQFQGRMVSMIMQNENGPCPLVAIANVLSLRHDISLSTKISVISLPDLCEVIGNYIKSKGKEESGYSSGIIEVIRNPTSVLQGLQTGLDVNPCFSSNIDFTSNFATELMKMFNVPLYHSWIVSPDIDGFEAISRLDYDTLAQSILIAEHHIMEKKGEVEKCKSCSETSEPEVKMEIDKEGAPGPSPDIQVDDTTRANKIMEAHESQVDMEVDSAERPPVVVVDNASEVDRIEKEIENLEREVQQLRQFHDDSSFSQYTPYGVLLLQQTFPEGEFGVYFKYNHFSTLHKRNGQLYTLVTDIGYAQEEHVVWETLDIDTDTKLVDSNFISSNSRQKDEAVRKVMEHNSGYTKEEVGSAYDEALNSGERTTSVSLNQVLSILKSKHSVGVDQVKVRTLTEMGYSRTEAENVLRQFNGDVERALDHLLG